MSSSTSIVNYFHVIRDIIRAMHSLTNLQEVFDVVVAKSTEALNAKGAILRILDKETNLFEVRAAAGFGERYLKKGPVNTEAILVTLANPDKVHMITDIWNDPRVKYPKETWSEGIRMLLDVPLAVDADLAGILRVYLKEKRDLSEDEIDFLRTVAMQCACVIERVALMESQQSRFEHLASQFEKGSSLGRMAAGIAHEINNPLAGILLYSSNMSKKVPKGGPLEEALKIIISETQRCKKIIQGLLDFAREQAPEKFQADIDDILRSAVGIVENEFHLRQVSIHVKTSGEAVQTLVDKNQVEQVFINLLLNALHAVEDHYGLVTVQSAVDRADGKIKVQIMDNGSGIAPENIKKIFEPFFSTKSNGTGLGLAVSYGIIRNHNGDIRVSSIKGSGTCFTVEFPIVSVEEPAGVSK